MRLLFANPTLGTETKVKFMRALQHLDKQGVKELDEMLDSQGGFTQEAADRHRKEFGGYTDQDALFEGGCYACIPDFEHKKELFGKFLR